MKFEVEESLRIIIKKIKKKDQILFWSIQKKIFQIINSQNINHYKNLKKPLQKYKRVHIKKSFVLLFYLKEDIIHFYDLKHHDQVYSKGI